MPKYKKSTLLYTFVFLVFSGPLFPALFKMGSNTVSLIPGQSIEIPLYSSKPIGSDLTARGNFKKGDISLIPGPGCHLSKNNCTLIIKAAENSQYYTDIPVIVSTSSSTQKPIFNLSVIDPHQTQTVQHQLPKVLSKPIQLKNEINDEVVLTVSNTTSSTLYDVKASTLPRGLQSYSCSILKPGENCNLKLVQNKSMEKGDYLIPINSQQGILYYQILTILPPSISHPSTSATPISQFDFKDSSGSLIAQIIPHSISSTYYSSSSNGPVYQMIQVTNSGTSSVTLDYPQILGTDASHFSIDTTSANYAGTPTFCFNTPTLAGEDSCVMSIKSILGDPTQSPKTATLIISDGTSADTLTFTLTDTTYVYSGGGFNTLGNASVSGGNLLAQCTAGSCSNALQGTVGNNFASTNLSVGQWINAMTVTSSGNLIVGGVFGAIGGATSGATSGTAALLAQCIPGASIAGSSCFNQLGSTANANAINNPYIDSITFLGSNFIVLGGDFNQIRTISTPTGKLLARCSFTGAISNSSCTNFLSAATTKYANNTIAALTSLTSTSVNTGGLFSQIAAYPSSAPSSGTTYATCTNSTCSQGMSSNPNNSILGMTQDGTYLYMGGTATSIGGYVDSSGGYPLVQCAPATVTNCNNALSGSNDANGYIEGLTYSGGQLFVGGQFTSIGGATSVSSGNMLAVCTPGGGCSNFITDSNPYASGSDWRGGIFAIAVGNQTSIVQN